ncbi:complex I subunit 4 family protein [Actinomadura scrupuli]|uniref:complex I subunit 4 family protein n=1 Tax=Actinomadura scrupuli TaxID=559629 RepID=UPI003D964897
MMLIALLAVPLLGALASLAPPDRLGFKDDEARTWFARALGLLTSGLTLVLALVAALLFDHDRPSHMQLGVDWAWASAIGLRFHLGLDGVSLPLVALTALLTFLCFLYTIKHPPSARVLPGRDAGSAAGADPLPVRDADRLFTGLLLALEVGMLGTFAALDLVLFFVFFEVVLIPMYVVIALWGGPGRRAAAYKFILYTLLGSGVLLVGLLLIAVNAGTLDMVALAARHGDGLSRGVQVAAFLFVGLGLAVKAPMWPLHTWLPDAHTEAPTVGSVLLAGVLLKMGTYGFVRIALPMAPEGATTWAPWLGFLAVIGIIYGALACLAQRDLKRMIAYSSVGHMGFVLLGIATLTPIGVNAALFGNIAHGLITGLLFFLAGSVKERYGTGDLAELGGGMLARAPRLASFLTFAAIAGLGLPGLAGFWGEMLAMLGAYRPAAGLPRETFVTFMVFGGLGAVLTAAYFLRLLSTITHGPVGPVRAERPEPARVLAEGSPEVSLEASTQLSVQVPPIAAPTRYEYAAWVPLVALILVVGLWPKALLDLTTVPVQALLGGGR